MDSPYVFNSSWWNKYRKGKQSETFLAICYCFNIQTLPFFSDNSLLLCFPRARCTVECRKENKERRCVPLYQVAWETRGYSLSLCRWEGQGLEKWNVYSRSSTSGSRRTLGEPELATLGPAPLSHRSLRDAGPFVLTNPKCLRSAQGPSFSIQIVLESDWSQNVGWWFPYQFHISPHGIQAQGEKETSLEALLLTPLVPYPRYAYAGYYLDQVGQWWE